MPSQVAIIAGAGRFPFYVAREAKRQGHRVVAIGLSGWADEALKHEADAYEEIAVGELGRLIASLKSHAVRQAVMAGKVTKEVLFRHATTFDAEALKVIGQTRDFSVPALLGLIAKRLEADGITLLDSSTFLRANLCPSGTLTSRGPTPSEQQDIEVGLQAARTLAALDVGQTVIIKHGVIVAVEALEGTDAAIRRAHALAGKELIVVKTASAAQDRRFDLPIIGGETMAVARDSGVSCLAVEAGSTLLLEREAVIASANSAGICLLGVALPSA